MSSTLDQPRVLNRLCHMAALTKDGKTRAAIDDIVLSIFVLEASHFMSSAADITKAIKDFYGLSLPEPQVQTSLDDHLDAGKLYFSTQSYTYQLPLESKARLSSRVESARNLERRVREEWLASIDPGVVLDQQKLWQCLCTYLSKVFYRHGAETIQLFNPALSPTHQSAASLSSYLAEAITETGCSSDARTAEGAVRSFVTAPNAERTQYLAQLLDGTFTFFALSVDEATSAYLQGALEPLKIFLDTNYIFGMLNISTNPLVEVSRELIDFIRANNLPFELYYHDATLEEMYSSISYAAGAIKGRKWRPQSSRFAIASGQFDGLILRFHEQNAQSPIDPEVFLSPYDHMPTLLASHGFKHWQAEDGEQESIEVKGSLIAAYKEYMEERRPWKQKRYQALDHDIEVWLAVQKLRKNQNEERRTVLDVGALFLTNDTYFRRFDWEELRKRDAVGSVILPNHLLQVLRPFVPASPDFDRRFIETIASPEFRTAGNADPETAYKVLSYLDTYGKIDERTAIHMLTDTILADQVRQVQDDDAEIERVIENALLLQNAELLEQRDKAETERLGNLHRAEVAEQRLGEKDEAITALQQRLDTSVAESQKARDERLAQDKIREENAARLNGRVVAMEERAVFHGMLMRAVAIVVCGMIVTGLATRVFIWGWWWHHPKWWGLLMCTLLIWAGIAWSTVETRHRQACFLAIIIAAILVFVQIG